MQCLFNNVTEAQKAARNGQVLIANSVKCDVVKVVESVISHLHYVAVAADEIKKLCISPSDSHSCMAVLKKYDTHTLFLVSSDWLLTCIMIPLLNLFISMVSASSWSSCLLIGETSVTVLGLRLSLSIYSICTN